MSKNGRLAEAFACPGACFLACAFQAAPGVCIADMGYRYRLGAPLSEYFFNCGKTLGGIHRLSKTYAPAHRRADFFSRYSNSAICALLPPNRPVLREKLLALTARLREIRQTPQNYGLVHFDFSDGNYNIDYATGNITAFDFDNALYCFYMYDLANLWVHGTGWIQSEPDAEKRRAFMNEYFSHVLAGYTSQTPVDGETLARLGLFTRAVDMEGILDALECARNGDEPDEEALAYQMRCAENEYEWRGFFTPLYNPRAPFECESES